MTSKEISNRPKLRREAEALRVEALSISQAEALGKLAGLMKEAVDTSSGRKQRRGSRLAFVSGAKGTGKSSLIHTLRFATERDRVYKSNKDSTGKDEATKDKETKYKWDIVADVTAKLGTDTKVVRWLEPLTLDPLPPGSNLLGAVLSRIETAIGAVERDNKSARGALDPHGSLDRARNKLHSLKQDAIKALEGNLQEHAPRLDPNNYAIESSQAETTKIKLKERLDSVLDDILIGGGDDPTSAASENGIFAIFVDDLDLRPSKAIEALKLAHLLSSRRLFYIFVGSLPDLDHVLFLNVQGEFKALLGQDERSVELDKIEANANEIASSLLRKLIPSGQQIFVEDMTVAEALQYDTNAGLGDQLSEKLESLISSHRAMINDMASNPKISESEFPGKLFEFYKIKRDLDQKDKTKKREINIRKEHFVPRGIFELMDLLQNEDSHSKGQSHEPLYDGASILASTPRHIGDSFHLLAEIKLDDEAEKFLKAEREGGEAPRFEKFDRRGPIASWLYAMFRGHVDEDGWLTIPVQEALKNCVEEHDIWELSPPVGMRMRAIIGDTLAITPFEWRNSVGMAPMDLTINIARVLRHDLGVPKRQGDGRPSEKEFATLGKRTRPAFKLMHDFFKFSGIGVVTRRIEVEDELAAITKWELGFGRELIIHWAINSWPTFWHRDVFRDLWNEIFQETRNAFRQKSKIAETEYVAFLAMAWMAATLQTVDAQPGDKGLAQFIDENNINDAQSGILESKALFALNGIDESNNFWIIETKKIQDFAGQLVKNICCVFKVLVARILEGQLDDHARALQDRIVECILLCMPEAGAMCFAMKLEGSDKDISGKRAAVFAREKYIPGSVENMYIKVFSHICDFMRNLFDNNLSKEAYDDANLLGQCDLESNPDYHIKNSIERDLFHDIMREVRRRRVESIGPYIGTPLGLGLLTFNATIMRGDPLRDDEYWFEDKIEKYFSFSVGDNSTDFAVSKNVIDILKESRPSPSHLKKAFYNAKGDTDRPFDGKIRRDEWKYVERAMKDKPKQTSASGLPAPPGGDAP
jgi:hypothetical protein